MVVMETCCLSIDIISPENVCYAGENLVGVVRVDLKEPVDITGLELRIVGVVAVDWSERTSGGHRGSHREVHRATEQHVLDQTLVLWGAGRDVVNAEKEELPQGSHAFPFNYLLPKELPCSFDGSHGHVRYWLQTQLLCPTSRDNTGISDKASLHFTVLNNTTYIKEEAVKLAREERDIVMESLHSSAAMLCGVGRGKLGGRISCSLQLTCTTFVCGEYLPVDVKIHNISGFKVRTSTCRLIQTVTYKVNGKGRDENITTSNTLNKNEIITHEQIICQANGKMVLPGDQCSWKPKRMCIPSVPPSHLGSPSCRFNIQLSYRVELKVEAHTKCVMLTIPITIATSSNLDSQHLNFSLVRAFKFPTKKKALIRSQSFQSNQVRPHIGVEREGAFPVYHVYRGAPRADVMHDLEESPGLRRRKKAIFLDVNPDCGSVV